MFRQEFKLNKKNYKEIEYILNKYIEDQKELYKTTNEENQFYIEIIFDINNTMAIYKCVEEVKILEWSQGLKIFMNCNGVENSFFYRKDLEIYSEVEIDWVFSGGYKKNHFNGLEEGKYTSKTVYFRETKEMKY